MKYSVLIIAFLTISNLGWAASPIAVGKAKAARKVASFSKPKDPLKFTATKTVKAGGNSWQVGKVTTANSEYTVIKLANKDFYFSVPSEISEWKDASEYCAKIDGNKWSLPTPIEIEMAFRHWNFGKAMSDPAVEKFFQYDGFNRFFTSVPPFQETRSNFAQEPVLMLFNMGRRSCSNLALSDTMDCLGGFQLYAGASASAMCVRNEEE